MNNAAATAPILPADRFARIVTALASQLDGTPGAEWLFLLTVLGGRTVDVTVWRPRVGTLVLQLVIDDGAPTRTVTVTPGAFRAFDVIAADGFGLGETHGADAAFSIALDYVTAPVRAGVQHDHDAYAV